MDSPPRHRSLERLHARQTRLPATQRGVPRSVVEIHNDYWRSGDHITAYANRTLRPAEVVILARYHDDLSHSVLEVGCGAGRVLGYLLSLSERVVGIDLSEVMVAYCRETYPDADVDLGDLGAMSKSVEGPFDAIVAADNILGGFEDADRRRVLGEIRELLAPAGLLIFSSHNLARVSGMSVVRESGLGSKVLRASPERVARAVRRLPLRWRNRRRLAPLQYRERDHAMLYDAETDYGMLHYYIGHAEQERQLWETGYDLVECIDADGRTLRAGEGGWGAHLYYVARKTSREPGSPRLTGGA